MELDTFLSSPRWDILQVIIKNPSSPMEIAKQLDVTISFVSQQLKLLEATGLVTKKRTGEVNKGKPRTIFSISKESMYMIPLAKGVEEKRLVPLSREHKTIVKIWQLDEKIQFVLEKFFWAIQKFLDSIISINVYTKKDTPKIYITSKDRDLTHKINEAKKALDEPLEFQVTTSSSSLSNLDSGFIVSIYDEQEYLANEHLLKGGLKAR